MKHTLLLCGLLISQPLLMAVDIVVGLTLLSIPSPDGYSPITSDMQPYADIAKRFVPPSNELLAMFLPDADIAVAARGAIPEPKRWFSVQTEKTVTQTFVSTSDFAQVKQMIKTQNEEIFKKVESLVPGLFQKINEGISADYDVDLDLSLDQMLPLPPHYETEQSFAYSTLLKLKINDGDGKPSVLEGVVTATFVYIQGKVLCLYANADKSELDWSRSESRKWAETIIAANPTTGDIPGSESSLSRTGFDWSKVFGNAVPWVIIGGIVGALGYVLRKKQG